MALTFQCSVHLNRVVRAGAWFQCMNAVTTPMKTNKNNPTKSTHPLLAIVPTPTTPTTGVTSFVLKRVINAAKRKVAGCRSNATANATILGPLNLCVESVNKPFTGPSKGRYNLRPVLN